VALTARTVAAAGAGFPVLDAGGAGAPVLFLHGALGDARTLAPVAERLGPGLRGLTVTQRWFGGLDWPDDPRGFGVSAHAEDAVALTAALGLGPVHLVAWSYACHVALVAALAAPGCFASLVLYEPGVPSWLAGADRAAFAADAGALYGPLFAAPDAASAARVMMEGVGPGLWETLAPDRRAILDTNMATMPMLLKQTPPPAVTATDLARLDLPVLVTWGEASRPAFTLPARAAAAALPCGQGREIARAGHMWPEQDPAAFAALVRGFVTGQAHTR
jgi:pimeloyl-ACP methyl ester carboxylesterase